MTDTTCRDLLNKCLSGEALSREETRWAFGQIMDGRWSEAQIAALLVALAVRGETPDEIAGAAEAMREHVVRVDSDGMDVVDTCGTGGTGLSTFNISTAAALVAAGAGAKVAKHGNRTSTRASGSANVLDVLGVNLDASPDVVASCLAEAGVCFCFAVKHHPAMKFAAAVRKQIGVRTIFNVLGPLTNPAGARRQVMGVYDADLTETIAETLGRLGAVRAIVVHADDGLDEISTTSETKISELKDGSVRTRRVRPEDFGLQRAKMDEMLIDSAEASAEAIKAVLAGEKGPRREIVIVNAAAALVAAGKARDIPAGMKMAETSIDSGAAGEALKKLVEVSNA